MRRFRPMYPDDGGLKKPVRAYADTFDVWTVIKEMYFPEMLTEREREQILARGSKRSAVPVNNGRK